MGWRSMVCRSLPCVPYFSRSTAFIGYYQSIEKAMVSTVYTLLRGILFLVPCFVLLPRTFGVPGLWLAIPAAELLTCAVIYIRYVRQKIISVTKY